MPKVPKVVCELTVTEIKNLGVRESHWSDDENKWITTGPNYVRIVAVNEEMDQALSMKLEVPQKLARLLKIGGKVVIT